jgi:hypothetical protein
MPGSYKQGYRSRKPRDFDYRNAQKEESAGAPSPDFK